MNYQLTQPLFETLIKQLQYKLHPILNNAQINFSSVKEQCLSLEYQILYKTPYSANSGIFIMKSSLTEHLKNKIIKQKSLPKDQISICKQDYQQNNDETWHGIYFIRNGTYKNGKFKFKISFDTFPRRPPKIYFMSSVNHPKIDTQTGQLSLPNQFNQNWAYGDRHFILSLIEYMRILFLDPHFFLSLQTNSAEKQQKNSQWWYLKAKECVFASNNQLYTNYQDTSFKFVEYQDQSSNQKITKQLIRLCDEQQGLKHISFQAKKAKLIEKIRQNIIMKVIQNVQGLKLIE